MSIARRFQNFLGIFQVRMGEVHSGSHTIMSHGAKLAWNHLYDWLILLLLLVIEVVLYLITPFYRFVGKDMMDDLKYPLKDNTVPVWSVPLYAVLLPVSIFLFFYFRRRDVYDLHHSILGLLFSVMITAVITDAIKDGVGRPRPDFFWRCFPDGIDSYDRWGNVICHGKASVIKEGHKSFPSGHTAWSFAGLGFLSLYLSGKIRAFDRNGHIAKLCIVFLPLVAAALVGVSRVDDYWHHWQDVFAGGLIGLVVAGFCYRQFFAYPYEDEGKISAIIKMLMPFCLVGLTNLVFRHFLDQNSLVSNCEYFLVLNQLLGWGPYAYFRAMDESRTNTNTVEAMPVQGQVARQQLRDVLQIRDQYEAFPLEDVESGSS